MRVLFVDDDTALSQGVEMALREQGHACELAELGKQAVALSKREKYDIVVLDVGLPDIDGCHVARLLKMDGVDTPVLLHSGLADPALPDEAEELGVNGFLAKPFSIAELIEHMEAVLAGRGFVGPRDTTPPQPAPRPETPAEPAPQPEGDAEASEPHRPSAVAKARAVLRAQPEEPTRLEAMTKTGSGVLSKAMATARNAMATTVEAGTRLLPDSGESPEAGAAPRIAGAARTLSGVVAKARGALGEGTPGGEALSKARAALGAEKVAETVGKVRGALAGKHAAPAPPRGRKAGLQGRARKLVGSVAQARAETPPHPPERPQVEREIEPAPVHPPAMESGPRAETMEEIQAAAPAPVPPPDTPRPEPGPVMPPDPPPEPRAEHEIRPAPDPLPADPAAPAPKAADEIEPAKPDPTLSAQAAPRPDAETGVPTPPPAEPHAETESEPVPDPLPTGPSGPNPQAADEIGAAPPQPDPPQPDPPQPEPPQEAPRAAAEPDVPPGPPGERQGERETEPPSAVHSEPVPEAPQEAPRHGAGLDTAFGGSGSPAAVFAADAASHAPSGEGTEPDPGAEEQIEAAAPDPEAPPSAPVPDPEPEIAGHAPGEPEAASESEAVPDDLLDALFGPEAELELGSEQPADQRRPAAEAAVIVESDGRHGCVVLEWTQSGAVLRLRHPERDLSETFTLQVLDGSELRCALSWRKDDKIGVDLL